MSNEEKILELLGKMQADLDEMKAELAAVRNKLQVSRVRTITPEKSKELILQMSKIFTKEEVDELERNIIANRRLPVE